ncbi:MAG: hypothetical protein H7249_00285 [Chitinophagaceae bacterium]|nr:hypothetical protein [Oligoflexus sp.]
MKVSTIPIVLTLTLGLILTSSCKKYASSRLTFGSSDGLNADPGAAPAVSDPAATDTSTSTDSSTPTTDPAAAGGGGGSSTTSTTGASGSGTTVMFWSGTTFIGKASGEGYVLDTGLKKTQPMEKPLASSLKPVGKPQPAEDSQATEVLALVAAGKQGNPTHTIADCSDDKFLGENYIAITKNGNKEMVGIIENSSCKCNYYIPNATYLKVAQWFKTTFPATTTTTTTTTASPSTGAVH